MSKHKIYLFLWVIFISIHGLLPATELDESVDNAIAYAKSQYTDFVNSMNGDYQSYPVYTEENQLGYYWWHLSEITDTGTGGWAPGFFPGILWRLYELSGESFFKTNAENWTVRIELRQDNGGSDLGSNTFSAFYPQYRVNGDENSKQVLLEGAELIASSWHTRAGVLGYNRKADTDGKDYWHVFIDHMPNLEMIFWGAENNPDSTVGDEWYDKGVSHALKMGEHMVNPKIYGTNPVEYREGTGQRGYFDHTTGAFMFCEAKQGWNHESTWSRGQSWAMYGFASAYEYTKNETILESAKTTIDYFINHLPANLPGDRNIPGDYVPQWDFDYTTQRDNTETLIYPDTERDTSAGAMGLAAILKLIKVLPVDDPDRIRYWQAACQIMESMTSTDYLSEGSTPKTEAVLLHGCYHHYDCYSPGSKASSDLGLIWGDYFFVLALQYYKELADEMNEIMSVVQTNPQPEQFVLKTNYPNPFNPSTTIPYTLNRTSNVKVIVYDLLGNQVEVLADEIQSGGSYSVTWNGTNQNGNKVASGVYLIRMQVEDQVQMLKIQLLK